MTIKIADVFPGLSPKQRKVCALLMRGLNNKEVGRILGISHRTVEDHKYEMFRRIEVDSVGELLWRAYGCPEVVA